MRCWYVGGEELCDERLHEAGLVGEYGPVDLVQHLLHRIRVLGLHARQHVVERDLARERVGLEDGLEVGVELGGGLVLLGHHVLQHLARHDREERAQHLRVRLGNLRCM